MRGSRYVPPSMSGTPQRRSRQPKRADRPATRRSHHAANSMPPATHQPSIAAITGFDSCRRVGPSGPDGRSAGRSRRFGAGAERVVVAGEHRHLRGVVGVERDELVVQPLGRRRVDCVAGLGLIDAHDPHGAVRVALITADVTVSARCASSPGPPEGLRLVAPPARTPARRPTGSGGDLQRPRLDGALEDATVLDLFAGSGAMGIEALSRGARHATFVERDRKAARRDPRQPRDHRARRPGHRGRHRTFLSQRRPRPSTSPCSTRRTRSIVGATCWRCCPAEVAVLESDRPIDPGEGWAVVRSRRYGTTVVTICRRSSETQENPT